MPIYSNPAHLRRTLLDGLDNQVRATVETIAALCAERSIPLYVVGGALRDAMRAPAATADIDLVVEHDAIELVRDAAINGRITAHKRFRTATIDLGAPRAGTGRIDLATARSETYARPGALPKVAPADIETDLRRRDFTVNAMALRLHGEAALLDPCGGIDDLRVGRIRVLHDASFRDDATRIFRAFRYAARLRFAIEPRTRALLDAAITHIPRLSGQRLRREVERILDENEAECTALEELGSVGALRAVHPRLTWRYETSGWYIDRYMYGNLSFDEFVPFGFALLTAGASSDEASAIIHRLTLRRAEAAAVMELAKLKAVAPLLQRQEAKPSGVVQILDRYSAAALAAYGWIEGGNTIVGTLVFRYLHEWRDVKPLLKGNDLIAMNVPEGPRIAQALQLLRAARLDGIAKDIDHERALVARFVAAIRESSAMNASVELHLNGH